MNDDLTLEKLKIHERLASLETMLRDVFIEVRKDVDKHDEAIYGNGKPGLKTIVERLKEAEERRTWTIRAIGMAVIGLVANFIKETLLKR
jgi:hypothetical protein